MRKFAVLGASALVLTLGVVAASAEPFNPVTGYNGSANGGYSLSEGRAAAVEGSGPYFRIPVPFVDRSVPAQSSLEQFHEGK